MKHEKHYFVTYSSTSNYIKKKKNEGDEMKDEKYYFVTYNLQLLKKKWKKEGWKEDECNGMGVQKKQTKHAK